MATIVFDKDPAGNPERIAVDDGACHISHANATEEGKTYSAVIKEDAAGKVTVALFLNRRWTPTHQKPLLRKMVELAYRQTFHGLATTEPAEMDMDPVEHVRPEVELLTADFNTSPWLYVQQIGRAYRPGMIERTRCADIVRAAMPQATGETFAVLTDLLERIEAPAPDARTMDMFGEPPNGPR